MGATITSGTYEGPERRSSKPGSYRGPDRRGRTIGASPLPPLRVVEVLSTVAAVTAVPVGIAWLVGRDVTQVVSVIRVVASLVAVTAGVVELVRWRVTGAAFAGWFGAALFCFGGVTLTGQQLGDASAAGLGAAPMLYQRLALVFTVGALLWRAARTPEVDAGLLPLRPLLATAVAAVALIGTVDLLAGRGLIDWRGLPGVTALCATVAGWLALAAMLEGSGRRRRHAGWAPPAVVLGLAGADGARLFALAGGRPWTLLAPSALTLGATLLAVAAASWELREALRSQDQMAVHLSVDLRSARDLLEAEQRSLQERLHDLRNAVAATRTADSTLRRYAARLDDGTRAALADALTAELGRLQALIEPGRPVVAADFSLEEASAPVVATELAFGAPVDADLGGRWAHGDPAAFAQVLQNLLVNARRYAPGSPVTVEAATRAGRVEIRVRDRGPGVTAEERLAIFGRGERGRSSRGTEGEGLGLYISARLMASMGGTLRLADSPGRGACFVIELPAASAAHLPHRLDPAALRGASDDAA